ncbi:hypothetical protein MMC34_004855 [Xylographa carneopallida]|nr:hypothetical protein [Xylographa carneopallida]
MIFSRGSSPITTTNAGLTIPDIVGFALGLVGFVVLLILVIWLWNRHSRRKEKTTKQEESFARQRYDYQSAGLGISLVPQKSASKGVVGMSQRELLQTNSFELYHPQSYSTKTLQSPPTAFLSSPRDGQPSMTIKIEPPTPPRPRGRIMSPGQMPLVAMAPIPEARAVLLHQLEDMAHTHPDDAVVSEVPSDASSQYSRYLPEERPLSGPSDTTEASEFNIDKPNEIYRKIRNPFFERGDRTRSEIALISSLGSEGTDRSIGGQKKNGYLDRSRSRALGQGNRLTVPRPLNVTKRNRDGDVVDTRGLGVGHLESELDELSRANSTRR